MTNSGFEPDIRPPPERQGQAFWFLCSSTNLICDVRNGSPTLPRMLSPADFGFALTEEFYLGALDGTPCFAAAVEEDALSEADLAFCGLRDLLGAMPPAELAAALRAVHLVRWDQTTRCCGRCGVRTEHKSDERAKICPGCGLVSYPQIAPAVIVAVTRGDRILLARSHRHPPGRYSVLAGFVEPGETLEEAVSREVKEEVGVELQDVRYFASQPWPFPNSLMIAFTAEWAGGEIAVDTAELAEAAWFRASEMPPIPPKVTVSRALIDWFVGRAAGRPG